MFAPQRTTGPLLGLPRHLLPTTAWLCASRHSAPARVAPHFCGAMLGVKSVVVSQLVGGGRLAAGCPSRRSLTTAALRPARTGRPLPAAPQAAAAAPAAAAAVYEVGKGIHLLERSECSGSSSSGCRCLYLHGPPSLGAILPPPLLVRPQRAWPPALPPLLAFSSARQHRTRTLGDQPPTRSCRRPPVFPWWTL